MLPETFSTRELHETLCGLSYEGDVRTAFGAEDVGKIPRVAAGSRAGLREMYADAIARFRSNPAIGLTAVGTSVDRGDCDWGQDKSAAARSALLETLPRKALALAAVSAGAGAEAAAAAIASRASPERTRDVVRRANRCDRVSVVRAAVDVRDPEHEPEEVVDVRARQGGEIRRVAARGDAGGRDRKCGVP
jgi:translocator assembly and maintenance protein 41